MLAGMEKQAGTVHPSDLNNTQWALIEPLLPSKLSRHGHNRIWSLREIVDAITLASYWQIPAFALQSHIDFAN